MVVVCAEGPTLDPLVRVGVELLRRVRPVAAVPYGLHLPLRMAVGEDDVAALIAVILQGALQLAAVQVPRQRRLGVELRKERAVLRRPVDAVELVAYVRGIGLVVIGGLD